MANLGWLGCIRVIIAPLAWNLAVMSDPKSSVTSAKADKPIGPLIAKLRVLWLGWLGYRLLVLPVMIAVLSAQELDIIGGIAWQALWLIPAFVMTPVMMKGRSPYLLLISSMFTLVYLGASAVVIFARSYAVDLSVIWIYVVDTLLLFMINGVLFVLLKRLPSMNKSVTT